jgi:hypothetical protein
MMSSTTITSRPVIGPDRSFRIRTWPLDSVDAPYDDSSIRSTLSGTGMERMRSARKINEPFRTLTSTGKRPS